MQTLKITIHEKSSSYNSSPNIILDTHFLLHIIHTILLANHFRYHPINSKLISFVLQGRLDDGRRIAVKQLCLDMSGQGESEFLAEVRMLTSIQHKNLVRLIGCCSEGSHRLVVYEFMKNRSLDCLIYGLYS